MRVALHSFRLSKAFYSTLVRTPARGLCGAAMRLVQFHRHGDEGATRVGVEQAEGLGVVDLTTFDPSMPTTMRGLLELGDKGIECAQR